MVWWNVWAVSAIVCPSPVFNPIRDHQLKISLNVGLLPTSNGLYAFSYVCYRYKFGGSFHPRGPLPAERRIYITLRTHLGSVRTGKPIPSILAFTKGKRPALRPRFTRVVSSAYTLHSRCFPGTGVDILDGSARVLGPSIFRTLGGISGGVLGLSAMSMSCVRAMSQPANRCSLPHLMRHVGRFGKRVVVRAVFLGNAVRNQSISGASSHFMAP